MVYYRRNLLVLSATVFLSSLSWNQVIPFLSLFLEKDLKAGSHVHAWVAIVLSCQSIAALIAIPLWGKMGDSHGRKPMTISAGLCLAAVYFGMSFCRAPWQLAVIRFLNGALTGFMPGSFALVATNTPKEHSPRYIATMEAAMNVGVVFGPAVGWELAQIFGYRSSMRVSGTLVLLATLLVWLLVEERNKVSLTEKTTLIQDFLISVKSPVLMSTMMAMVLCFCFSAAIAPFLVLHLRSIGAANLTGWIFPLPSLAIVLTARKWVRFGERRDFRRVYYDRAHRRRHWKHRAFRDIEQVGFRGGLLHYGPVRGCRKPHGRRDHLY